MNYYDISVTVVRRKAVLRGERRRADIRSGNIFLGCAQPIIKPDAVIEHAGIARSVRFLARHFHTPIRVPDLVVVAGLSRRGFLKSFRKHTGRTPGEVLRGMRIELAQRLLAEDELTSADVALASGFRKTNSFLVAFKSVTGCSPVEYRTHVRAGINSHDRWTGINGARQPYAAPRLASGRRDWNL